MTLISVRLNHIRTPGGDRGEHAVRQPVGKGPHTHVDFGCEQRGRARGREATTTTGRTVVRDTALSGEVTREPVTRPG